MNTLPPDAVTRIATSVRLADRDELQAAFNEHTAQLARSADECIRLTNECNALRTALTGVFQWAVIGADTGVGRKNNAHVDIARARKLIREDVAHRNAPARSIDEVRTRT